MIVSLALILFSQSFKAQTNQTKIKDLVATKADCWVASCRLCFDQKAALERTVKSKSDSQLVHTGNNSPHQQATVVCNHLSKRETGRTTGRIQDAS